MVKAICRAGALIAGIMVVSCADGAELVIASYNVENLFDAVYDGTEYPAFDPRTDSWGPDRYARSLENTAHVIAELGYGKGADVLALQEIENQRVLADLAVELEQLGYRYKILVANSGPFHNAVFSRYPVTAVRTHGLSLPWAAPGRYILEVDIKWPPQPIRLFVNHWHSKVSGVQESEASRREAAAILVRRIRETILEKGPPVVAAGDLNASADEYVRRDRAYATALRPESTLGVYNPADGLFLTSSRERAGVSPDGLVLYSPWKSRLHGRTAGAKREPPGTYVFRGRWNSLDHILLGPGFQRCDVDGTPGKLYADGFKVVAEPYMLNAHGAPLRRRSDRATGYSDHLPVQITLRAGEVPDQQMKDVCHTRRLPSWRFSGVRGGVPQSVKVH